MQNIVAPEVTLKTSASETPHLNIETVAQPERNTAASSGYPGVRKSHQTASSLFTILKSEGLVWGTQLDYVPAELLPIFSTISATQSGSGKVDSGL